MHIIFKVVSDKIELIIIIEHYLKVNVEDMNEEARTLA